MQALRASVVQDLRRPIREEIRKALMNKDLTTRIVQQVLVEPTIQALVSQRVRQEVLTILSTEIITQPTGIAQPTGYQEGPTVMDRPEPEINSRNEGIAPVQEVKTAAGKKISQVDARSVSPPSRSTPRSRSRNRRRRISRNGRNESRRGESHKEQHQDNRSKL